MDFIFQGFQSALPFWSYLLIFIGTVLLAWWSYKDIGGISRVGRFFLISLRSATFFILLLVLLNPFIKTETPYTERPNILVMLDNSASTAIEKNKYEGSESYRRLLSGLNFRDSASVNFDFYTFGRDLRSTGLDSLSFDEEQTDISRPLQAIVANQGEAQAAVLITDGIYTRGQNPVYEAGSVEIPIFSVGLGDTTVQKDLLVRSVSTNSTGYLNTTQPVSVTIGSNGFKGETFEVQLRDGSDIRSSKTVTPEITNATTELSFDLKLEEEGLSQYQIYIPARQGEWTVDNNSQRFSVDVKDARQNILSLAFEVHPDVRLWRSLLLEDQNTRLIKRTWISGNRFIEGAYDFNADSLDLAIIHGYPRSGLSGGLQKQLAELYRQLPVIVAATPLFDPRRFEQRMGSLPVSVSGEWRYANTGLLPRPQAETHPIMELSNISYERLPSLSAPVENIGNTVGSTVLFSSSFRGENAESPALAVQEIGNLRRTFFASFGWYLLEQSGNPRMKSFARELLLNTVSWTATDPENQLLEVNPAQTSFGGAENVIINAYLTNERGEVETDASIDIAISSSADTTDDSFYSMEHIGSGRYRLDLGIMPEGLYSFEARAEKDNREIDSRSGEFAVSSSNVEFIDTRRNDRILRQISERSGGAYFPYDSVDGFWSEMDERELLESKTRYQTDFFYPYQHLGWFIAVILLLAAEWTYRKYLSLP